MKTKLSVTVGKIQFPSWSIPLALLLLIFLAFGLLIPWLGFFQDDWYLVWLPRTFGPGVFINFFQHMRPLLAGIYMLTTQIVGTSPAAWQLFAILCRWLAVLSGWWALRTLWPRNFRQVTWIAFLIAIYPAFKQHYVSVVYSQVYLILAAFLFSLGAMLLAVRRPSWRWPLTLVALLCSILSLVSTEYFFGLEFLRPILLWMVISEQPRSSWERIRLVFTHWLPYLLATLAFLAWRLFFFEFSMYQPKLALDLVVSPIRAVFNLLQTIFRDFFTTNLFAWVQPFEFLRKPYASIGQFILDWIIVITSTILIIFYLSRLKEPAQSTSDVENQSTNRWSKQAIFLGLCAALVAGWPYWFAGLNAELDIPFDRFTLAFMPGAAILFVGLLEWLVKTERQKVVILSFIIGLAILVQLKSADSFRYVHQGHEGLFRQLVLRAPGLKPDTVILMNEIPYQHSGTSSMTAALNWLYAEKLEFPKIDYEILYIPDKIGSKELPQLSKDIPVRDENWLEFNGSTSNALVVYYAPPGCALVIDPTYGNQLPRLPDFIQEASPLSNLNQIKPFDELASQQIRQIFGRAPDPNWCYYFEKADLARQINNWDAIVVLGDQARAASLAPAEKQSAEWLPFIEGYGRTKHWNEAYNLTRSTMNDVPALKASLCNLWNRVIQNTPDSAERRDKVEKLEKLLNCSID